MELIAGLGTPETNQLIVNIFLTVLTLVVGVVTRAVLTNIRTRSSDQQWEVFKDIVKTAVFAAEQGAIAGFVTDKKMSALNFITAALAQAGIKVDPAVIDATIEATVASEFNRFKLPPYDKDPFFGPAADPGDGEPSA